MITWIFDEATLNETIEKWVDVQIATGHPTAAKNAKFVGAAVKDLLHSNPKMYKETEIKPVSPAVSASLSTPEPNHGQENPPPKPTPIETKESTSTQAMSIEQLKSEWYK